MNAPTRDETTSVTGPLTEREKKTCREWGENLAAEAHGYKATICTGSAQPLCTLRACTVLPSARLKHRGALTY